MQFVQNNLILYVRYWADAERYFPILILAVQLSAFGFVLLWNQVSRRIGKQGTYYVGMGFWILVSLVLFFVQPGQIVALFALAVLAGAASASAT